MARAVVKACVGCLVAALVGFAAGGDAAVSSGADVSFAPARHCYCTGNSPWAIAIGDLDRDGNADLALADHDSAQVSVLLGKGDGTFRDALHFPLPDYTLAIALGDLNHDGKLDVVAGNQ